MGKNLSGKNLVKPIFPISLKVCGAIFPVHEGGGFSWDQVLDIAFALSLPGQPKIQPPLVGPSVVPSANVQLHLHSAAQAFRSKQAQCKSKGIAKKEKYWLKWADATVYT